MATLLFKCLKWRTMVIMIIPKALLMTVITSIFIFSTANISYQQVELPFADNVEGDGGEEEESATADEGDGGEEEESATADEGDGGEEEESATADEGDGGEEEEAATACIDYEAGENTIVINCNASFLDVVQAINEPEILEQEE